MNKYLDLINKNRGVVATSIISLTVGFVSGYAVRANRYEKVILDIDEDGNLAGDFVDTVKEQVSDELVGQISRNDSRVVSPKSLDMVLAAKREQEAIREELIKEGTNFNDYSIVDDGFPTYPTGRPNPKDIIVKQDVDEIHWRWDKEKAAREGKRIYVLHKDEFYADEHEEVVSQNTLTYYEQDQILADEDDTPVHDKSIIGELKFGHGSGDPDVYYVRNLDLHAEYEVILISDVSYAAMILDVQEE